MDLILKLEGKKNLWTDLIRVNFKANNFPFLGT